MAEHSDIEWTHHTFNPWQGCSKVSEGCRHCYAERYDARHLHGDEDHWGPTAPRRLQSDAYWRQPRRWARAAERLGVRHRVFCASLGDVFEGRPDLDDHRARLWQLIDETPSLDWLLLTKRPQNMEGMLPRGWLDAPRANVWLGTSTETQAAATERLPVLLDVPAAIHFISAEPLLGPLNLSPWMERLDWVIVGGESGPAARPMSTEWARDLRDQCLGRVPFFFKQMGARVGKGAKILDGVAHREFPAYRCRRSDTTGGSRLGTACMGLQA